jgi:hypothetical protein
VECFQVEIGNVFLDFGDKIFDFSGNKGGDLLDFFDQSLVQLLQLPHLPLEDSTGDA